MEKVTFKAARAFIAILFFLSLKGFAQSNDNQHYTPSYLNPNQPDIDLDGVIDYYDIDDDQDGLTDVTEGCNDFDIENLIGDSSKAKKELGWEPKMSYEKLIETMVDSDINDPLAVPNQDNGTSSTAQLTRAARLRRSPSTSVGWARAAFRVVAARS